MLILPTLWESLHTIVVNLNALLLPYNIQFSFFSFPEPRSISLYGLLTHKHLQYNNSFDIYLKQHSTFYQQVICIAIGISTSWARGKLAMSNSIALFLVMKGWGEQHHGYLECFTLKRKLWETPRIYIPSQTVGARWRKVSTDPNSSLIGWLQIKFALVYSSQNNRPRAS